MKNRAARVSSFLPTALMARDKCDRCPNMSRKSKNVFIYFVLIIFVLYVCYALLKCIWLLRKLYYDRLGHD